LIFFYQSYVWLFGNIRTNDDDDKCVLSNEDDNCKFRCLFKTLSDVVVDEIDLERWIGILLLLLLLTDGGFVYAFVYGERFGIGGL
jgi:hypothetical protein